MLAMNAGVKGYEIFNILHSIEVDGRWIPKNEIAYGYRYAKLPGIATSARFQIIPHYDTKLHQELLAMRNNQPPHPSAGSAFKNPEGKYAGQLIEAVGLKGSRKGGMAWSDIHANFLVNLGGGTFNDAVSLLLLAKERVKSDFNVILQEEIKIL